MTMPHRLSRASLHVFGAYRGLYLHLLFISLDAAGLSACFVLNGKLLLRTVSKTREVFSLPRVLSVLIK